jgi:tRNA uridine 5-carboxymethylaminomethyl modification enzyme
MVAGINAARHARGEEDVLFPRSESFIGVMIDDLVTKGVEDPYRMLTARSEHRLLLRHDNADQRLTPLARSIGLCSEERWGRFSEKQERVESGLGWLKDNAVGSGSNPELERMGLGPVSNKTTLFDLLRRPDASLQDVVALANSVGLGGIPVLGSAGEIDAPVGVQLELAAKYDGYLQIQSRGVARVQKLESLRIPLAFDYERLPGLSFETVDKLTRIKPLTLGQASRVPGVRPSDIALLVGHLRSWAESNKEPALPPGP